MKKETEEKNLKIENSWHLFDAKDQVVGRLSTKIAMKLMGKDSASWRPNNDPKVSVVVINASKVSFTGQKEEDKKYFNYSGYPGGLKQSTPKSLRENKSDRIIYHAVRGMLPKNKLADKIITRLFIYSDSNHPHEAQKPVEVEK